MTYSTPTTPTLANYTISLGAETDSENVLTGSLELVLEGTGSEPPADELVQSIVDALSGIEGLTTHAQKRFRSVAVITPTEAPE